MRQAAAQVQSCCRFAPSEIDRDAIFHPVAIAGRAERLGNGFPGRRLRLGRGGVVPMCRLGELARALCGAFGHAAMMGRLAREDKAG